VVYDVMTLNKSNDNDLRSLMEAQYVLPLANMDRPNIIVWLPDFLRFNIITSTTKGYKPSQYRNMLRDKYPWAPLLIVRDAKNNIRRDIINDNDNIGPDPRTNILYQTPPSQCDKNRNISYEEPLGNLGEYPNKQNQNKLNQIKYNDMVDIIITHYNAVMQDNLHINDNLIRIIHDALERYSLEDVICAINGASAYHTHCKNKGNAFYPRLEWILRDGYATCRNMMDAPAIHPSKEPSYKVGDMHREQPIDEERLLARK